jgi:soluble lytic murein transglycosylase
MAQQTFEEIVDAVMQAESRGKRYKDDGKTLTTSPKGALGEMQVMPKTSRDPGFGVVPAKDKSPDEIARVGKDYLQAMLGKYGDTEKALIAYNWGPGVTDKWLAAGANPDKLPAETRTYVQRVKGFLGSKDVPRETSVAKKEREPLPPSLPPMAQAPSVKPEAAARVASLGPGYQAAFVQYHNPFSFCRATTAGDDEGRWGCKC